MKNLTKILFSICILLNFRSNAQNTKVLQHEFKLGLGALTIDEQASYQGNFSYGLNWRRHVLTIQGTLAKQIGLGLPDFKKPISLYEFNLKFGYKFAKKDFYFQPNIGIASIGLNSGYSPAPLLVIYDPVLTVDLDLGYKINRKSGLGMDLFYHNYIWNMIGGSIYYYVNL